jgi:hypothetical protein
LSRNHLLAAAAAAVLLPASVSLAQVFSPDQAQLETFNNSPFGQQGTVASIVPDGNGILVTADFGTNDDGKFNGDAVEAQYGGPATPGLQGSDLDLLGPDSGWNGASINFDLLSVTATGNSPSTTTAVTQTVDVGIYDQSRADGYDFNNTGAYQANLAIGTTTASSLLWSNFDNGDSSDAIDSFQFGFQIFPDDDGTDDAGDQSGAQFTMLITPTQAAHAWNLTGFGSYNNAQSWGGQAVPNGIGAEADFFGAISTPSSVVVDTPITLGTVHFNNANEYVLGGAGSLTLQVASGSALVQVDQGTDELNLPTVVASNTTLNIATGATLVVGNPLTINNGVAVTQTGGGTLTINSIVSLGSGSTLTVDYGTGTDPIGSIAAALATGYNGGAWNGVGIDSAAVASLNASQSKLVYSLGYADGANGSAVTTLPSGQILVEPTLAGDAKLQGNVVFGDFQILAQYFGKPGGWDEGNFKYGSTVNFGDFQLLAQDFGANAGAVTASQLASMDGFAAQFGDTLVPNADGVGFAVVSVPEPVSAGLLALGGLSLLGRRRARR